MNCFAKRIQLNCLVKNLKNQRKILKSLFRQFHYCKFFDNLCKIWTFIRISVPAPFHQLYPRFRGFRRYWRPQLFVQHIFRNLRAGNVFVGWLPWCNLPHYDCKTENVRFFSVSFVSNHFRCHPLISSNFISHVIL